MGFSREKLVYYQFRALGYCIVLSLLLLPEQALAYIGPGAGFAFIGSAFVFILTFFMAIATFAFWPLQWLWRKARGYGIPKKARARRVVILGLDGLEPKLVEKYMAEGQLPNLKALAEQGTFSRLGTTLPALSPVAWSTFQTGVNPGAHNIFDFLTRDKRYCLPLLSSTKTETTKSKFGIGRFSISFDKPKIDLLRKSQPFWKILGKTGIFCNIIRVPISYPPEKFSGNILSAMSTPDLRGTQGTFTYFTTRALPERISGDGTTGGEVRALQKIGDSFRAEIEGPGHPSKKNGGPLKIPFKLTPYAERAEALLEVGETKQVLKLNEFSPWISIEFSYGRRGKLPGICRFCLREVGPECSLYLSPLNADPERPVIPIAHPIYFSTWLAKRQGYFGTLGLMEDTWGRNELALDDQRFLDQAYLTHAEREKMFIDALDRTPEGVCCCVFDASDRIQHMFWRYLDPTHPSPCEAGAGLASAIPDMYRKMDELVGRTRAKLNPDDVFIVLSDHGFSSFRRCVNLNTWLFESGYLVLKETKTTGADYFLDVDWSKTKAFAVGLSGLYINQKGRERQGIVDPKDAQKLKDEIARKLEGLKDPEGGQPAISKVYDAVKAYRGLYAAEAPDLIVGYHPGYRVSWDSITGAVEPTVFSDNVKAWSGDHHVDPELIPGILFLNRKIKAERPNIIDIAPTVLDLFAVDVPGYMEGRVIV